MKDKILFAAEKRVRRAGFAEMSFRDLARDVGVKSASMHYHFLTKSDLGEALVDRYARAFKQQLDMIEIDDLTIALARFITLYEAALVLDESICRCTVLGAEAIGLPEKVNQKKQGILCHEQGLARTFVCPSPSGQRRGHRQYHSRCSRRRNDNRIHFTQQRDL
jgi:AcrR family transcriptional regulator